MTKQARAVGGEVVCGIEPPGPPATPDWMGRLKLFEPSDVPPCSAIGPRGGRIPIAAQAFPTDSEGTSADPLGLVLVLSRLVTITSLWLGPLATQQRCICCLAASRTFDSRSSGRCEVSSVDFMGNLQHHRFDARCLISGVKGLDAEP